MKNKYSFVLRPLILGSLLIFLSAGDLLSQSSFTGKPMYNVYTERLGVPLGSFTIELFPNIAPYHVQNFDSLVGQVFYDTTAFHRVIPGFMIQGGDPNSRHGPPSTWGFGQPWQPKVKAEFSVAKHVRGILSAARPGNNINGATSQFFICVATAANLDGNYSVYGRTTHGMNIVDSIVLSPRDAQDRPLKKIEMWITPIGSNDTVPNPPVLTSPLNNTVGVPTNVVPLKWLKVQDGIFYQVHVSHDSLFSDTVKLVDTPGLQYNLLALAIGTKYYWKVRVNNGGHYATSQIWNFTTTTPVGLVEKRVEGPTEVFPNPGRDKFTFNHMQPGYVLQITDVSGKMVGEFEVNAETITVDLGDKPKGTYLFRISSDGKEIQQGKIILQ